MKCRVQVGQCRAGGAGVHEDFGRGCRTQEDAQTWKCAGFLRLGPAFFQELTVRALQRVLS